VPHDLEAVPGDPLPGLATREWSDVPGEYEVVYADPPWSYYGDPNKDQAAGKHYRLLSDSEIAAFPVRSKCVGQAVLFLWATSPRLDSAIAVMRAWDFHYRGVAFVWVKTTKDGRIIHGQGVRPTFTKPISEFVLVGSTNRRGRAFPLLTESMGQVVLAPRGAHSEKPAKVRENIEALLGPRRRLEMFARGGTRPGWDLFGEGVTMESAA
jgi:N6-adenosine-specific RNA methylase IME4